ncbi:MAG: penicillin-binding protein 1C [Cyanobacteria bacterium J06639_1]
MNRYRWGAIARHWSRNPLTRLAIALVAIALPIRFIPYAIPIRAADLVQDDRAVTFRDRHGVYLGTLLSRDRDRTAVVELNDVSESFKQAILAAEDSGFYVHGALDLGAIARASYQWARHGRIVSGASTITMQLASMLDPQPRTARSKLTQVWQSWRLAAGMSRDEILYAYVNRLPMGGNIYGVEAAARLYFGMPASELDVTRASLLAALPNNPTRLDPYTNWAGLKQRQAYVLDRMVAEGFISQAQRDRAYAETPSLQDRNQGIDAAPHFLFWVAEQLPDDRPAVIQTTVDISLQQFVEAQTQAVVRSLEDRDVNHAAALVLDRESGEVLAYVGSPDYFGGDREARNDGVRALRQPGSTLKPFLYGLALERRAIRPHDILADVPVRYAIPGARVYSPVDYSETYQGPVRVRAALANSLNVPAVKVQERVGVPEFLTRLRSLGFTHLDRDPDHYGLGLALGSGEVSLWELATAYGTMARQGDAIAPVALLDDRPAKGENAIGSSETWALVADMLSDRFARAKSFGIDSALSLPFPAAVKTGTSSGYRDAWTVGFSSEYVVATWVGNFDGSPMQQVSGSRGAAPLWNRIMLHLHRDRLPAPLPSPQTLEQRSICALTGLPPNEDCPAIAREYLFPEDAAEHDRLAAAPPAFELSPQYGEWLADRPRSPLASDRLSILFPEDEDVFLLEMPTGGAVKTIQFQVSNPSGAPVSWWLGDRLLSEGSGDRAEWPLQPGIWDLTVRQGDREDSVRFEVISVERRAHRRGFSIAP